MYDSERMAKGYAFDRPPIHDAILQTVNLPRARRALDVGCAAGRSTSALKPFADKVVGLEPNRNMLRYNRNTNVVARAESLPFRDGIFDIVTAGGVVNYVDNTRFLPEAARVLSRGGTLLIYDFGSGSRARDGDQLAEWFRSFPTDPGYDLDVTGLDFAAAGLRLESYQEFEVVARMSLEAYHRYLLTETDANIEEHLSQTLPGVFTQPTLDVVFDTYAARVCHKS